MVVVANSKFALIHGARTGNIADQPALFLRKWFIENEPTVHASRHTPHGAVSLRTRQREVTRVRNLGVGMGRDSRYGSIYVCPPPPLDPAARYSSLPPPSPSLSPPDPTLSIRHTAGLWLGKVIRCSGRQWSVLVCSEWNVSAASLWRIARLTTTPRCYKNGMHQRVKKPKRTTS